jgi:hypothetical protein
MSKASIPLDMISVASPCHAEWNDMSGDDKSRFCGACSKYVYNLSAMTAHEAQSLIEEHEGKMCARFYKRSDGTVLTADCPVGWRAVQMRFVLIGSGALALMFMFFSVLTVSVIAMGERGHNGQGQARWANPIGVVRDWLFPPAPPMVMGEICPIPIPPPPVAPLPIEEAAN